eukprot:scaffold725_cov117-Isochrysis_galbana.AAC.5
MNLRPRATLLLAPSLHSALLARYACLLPELRLLAWVVSAAKTPLGVAAPPITTTAKGCPLQHPPESDLPIDHTIRLPTTIRTLPHIVLPISDPFLPTTAVLAGEDH